MQLNSKQEERLILELNCLKEQIFYEKELTKVSFVWSQEHVFDDFFVLTVDHGSGYDFTTVYVLANTTEMTKEALVTYNEARLKVLHVNSLFDGAVSREEKEKWSLLRNSFINEWIDQINKMINR